MLGVDKASSSSIETQVFLCTEIPRCQIASGSRISLLCVSGQNINLHVQMLQDKGIQESEETGENQEERYLLSGQTVVENLHNQTVSGMARVRNVVQTANVCG